MEAWGLEAAAGLRRRPDLRTDQSSGDILKFTQTTSLTLLPPRAAGGWGYLAETRAAMAALSSIGVALLISTAGLAAAPRA